MNTMIAESQNTDSEEGLQKANKKLQVAAGIFTNLKDRVVGLMEQEPTPDLEPDCLGVLSAFCLAQAQEMVVQKALKVKYILREVKKSLRYLNKQLRLIQFCKQRM